MIFDAHSDAFALVLLDEQDEAVQGVARVGEYARECASSDENAPAGVAHTVAYVNHYAREMWHVLQKRHLGFEFRAESHFQLVCAFGDGGFSRHLFLFAPVDCPRFEGIGEIPVVHIHFSGSICLAFNVSFYYNFHSSLYIYGLKIKLSSVICHYFHPQMFLSTDVFVVHRLSQINTDFFITLL